MTSNVLWVLMNLFLVFDWGQTRDIAKRSDLFREVSSPILTEHPTTREVDAYFLGALIVHNGIRYILPEDLKEVYTVGVIFLEVGMVSHNHALGIRVNF